jgi:hypothetical protein
VSRSAGRSPFTTMCRFSLRDDYLPDIVLGPSPGWFEIPFDDFPASHFVAYGGRCFVRSFLRVPGLSEAQVRDYLSVVARDFGVHATLSAKVPALPGGTETVLLRTFGTFMNDSSFADTHVPEEVLVRIFKYQVSQKVDMATSDYRGTLYYQYKLRRRKLLIDPSTLGLERVGENAPQFYGFFSEIPDLSQSRDETLATMRANCMGCHSELLYGASTVYSICRNSPVWADSISTQGGLLREAGGVGLLVEQEPLRSIQRELAERIHDRVTDSHSAIAP